MFSLFRLDDDRSNVLSRLMEVSIGVEEYAGLVEFVREKAALTVDTDHTQDHDLDH